MKKTLFAVLALAAVVGCAKEETLSYDKGHAINIGNVFVDNVTRADDSGLTNIVVCGTITGVGGTLNIFSNLFVTGTVGGTWSYDDSKTQYWVPGADYDFMAVGDQTAHYFDSTKDEYGMPTILTTVPNNVTNLNDMLFATAHVENAVANQGPVNFTFNHLLSKVHFTVTSNAQGDYYHTVTGIKVANYGSGTYTIAYADSDADGKDDGIWVGQTAKDVVFADIAEVTNAAGKSNADMLLVPITDDFNVTFTVESWNTNGTTSTDDDVKLTTETQTITVTNDLVKGNAYNFVIACAIGNPIQFSVNNDPTGWGNGGDVEVQ